MNTHPQLTAAESALRAHALAYPMAREEFPWGHRAIKVKGKVFVVLAMNEGVLRVSLKLPQSSRAALLFPFARPTGYGLGKSGWITASFKPADEIPLDLLQQWIDESFQAIAPKRLLAGKGEAVAQAKKAARSRRRAGVRKTRQRTPKARSQKRAAR